MAKWVSPLFADIRNKLGDSVIFSNWKGRPYFRKYAKPSNPRTDKQLAHRDVFRKLVKRFQEIKVDPEEKEQWDNKATPYQMSGFNLFLSRGRKSYIEVNTNSATAGSTIQIRYKVGFPVDEACIVVMKDNNYLETIEIAQAEGTLNYTVSAAGIYEFWIAEKDILDKDGHPSRITKWKPDPTLKAGREAVVTVT